MDNQFTVLTWNVNGFSLQDQPRLLARMEWDLACLQEVTRESWPAFQECGEDGAVAFDHLPTLASSDPRYACAVVVRDEARLIDFAVVPDVPSPERAAVATVQVAGGRLQLCAWAAPPGVSWGASGKGRQVDRFAAWLRDRHGPVVVGMDRNAPRWERHDLAEDEWWNRWEPLLYGPDRVHDLRDVYRDHLTNNPDLAAHLRQTHPGRAAGGHPSAAWNGLPVRRDLRLPRTAGRRRGAPPRPRPESRERPRHGAGPPVLAATLGDLAMNQLVGQSPGTSRSGPRGKGQM